MLRILQFKQNCYYNIKISKTTEHYKNIKNKKNLNVQKTKFNLYYSINRLQIQKWPFFPKIVFSGWAWKEQDPL